MALEKTTYLLGIKRCYFEAMTADPTDGDPTYSGTLIRLPGIKQFALTATVDTKKLTGDNITLEQISTLTDIAVATNYAKFDFDVTAALMGTVTDSGTTPNQVKEWLLTQDDATIDRSGRLVAVAAGTSLGIADFHVEVFKASPTVIPLPTLAEQDFGIQALSFSSVARASDGKWIAARAYETATAVTVAA